MPAPAPPKNGYSKARLSRYRTTSDAGVLYEISLCPELYTLRLKNIYLTATRRGLELLYSSILTCFRRKLHRFDLYETCISLVRLGTACYIFDFSKFFVENANFVLKNVEVYVIIEYELYC